VDPDAASAEPPHGTCTLADELKRSPLVTDEEQPQTEDRKQNDQDCGDAGRKEE